MNVTERVRSGIDRIGEFIPSTSVTDRVRRGVDRIEEVIPSNATRLGHLLRLSRPRFWFYLAGPVIVGVVYAADTVPALFSLTAIALFVYFLVPANVFLYGVNDIFDADVDAENPKKDDREVRYSGDTTILATILASGLLAFGFVPVLSTAALVAFAVFGFLAVEYSAPPLRFKTTPLLDSVSNGLYVLPGVVAYTAIAGEFPPLAAVLGGWFWTMGMHTFSAIPDIEPDRLVGIRTTATVLGERRTYGYCIVCWLAAALAFWYVHAFFGVLALAYPVLVFAIAQSSVDIERAYWWYPAVNTLVGMVMTLGGLWVLVFGD